MFYHILLKMRTSRLGHILRNVTMNVITSRYKICKPLVVYRIYCMALYNSQTFRHLINVLKIHVQLSSDAMDLCVALLS